MSDPRCNESAPSQMSGGPACFSSLKQIKDFTGDVGDKFWNYSCVNTSVNNNYTKKGEFWLQVPADSVDSTNGKQTFGSTIYAGSAEPGAFTLMGTEKPVGGKGVYWLSQGTSLVGYKDSGDGKGGQPIYSTCSPAGSGTASWFVTDTGDFIGKDNTTNEIIFARGCTVEAIGAIPGNPCSSQWPIQEKGTVAGEKADPGLCYGKNWNLTITQDGVIKLQRVDAAGHEQAIWWNANSTGSGFLGNSVKPSS